MITHIIGLYKRNISQNDAPIHRFVTLTPLMEEIMFPEDC